MPGLPPAGLQQLLMRAQQGDPDAAATLQEMGYGGGAPGGGGGMPPAGGMPPMAPAGGMPPMGGPGGGMPPPGAPPGGAMSQADFSGYGRPPNPDQQARQAAMLQQILRQRGMQ